jgi:hypothetical protein
MWEKACPSATSFTTNPAWPDLGPNLGWHGGEPAANCLSYGMALIILLGGYLSFHTELLDGLY